MTDQKQQSERANSVLGPGGLGAHVSVCVCVFLQWWWFVFGPDGGAATPDSVRQKQFNLNTQRPGGIGHNSI